jgi:5-methylthioadenosine/S-adenosylhomocysteine deaminase
MSVFHTADLVYAENEFRPGTYVEVDDGQILTVSKSKPPPSSQVHYHPDGAILPGAVNTHCHSYLSLLRGELDELQLSAWLARIYEEITVFDEQAAYVGALLAFGEMLLAGTTTVADFFYLNGAGNANVRAALRAAHALGIRVVMGRTLLDADWGGPATRETIAVAELRFRELHAEFMDDRLVTVSPAPHSLYGASRGMVELAAGLAVELDTLWYMHVSDSASSTIRVLQDLGDTSVEVLNDWNLLSNRLVSIHGIWLTDRELDLLGEHAGRISYNCASNMFFAERIVLLSELRRRGIRIGLGTDGAASNNALSVFREAQIAGLVQRVRARSVTELPTDDLINLATVDGGVLLDQPVGSIEPGLRADFIVLDLNDPSLLPTSCLKSNVVHSMAGSAVRHVFCDGRQVVRDRQLVGVSHAEIAELVNRLRPRNPDVDIQSGAEL